MSVELMTSKRGALLASSSGVVPEEETEGWSRPHKYVQDIRSYLQTVTRKQPQAKPKRAVGLAHRRTCWCPSLELLSSRRPHLPWISCVPPFHLPAYRPLFKTRFTHQLLQEGFPGLPIYTMCPPLNNFWTPCSSL